MYCCKGVVYYRNQSGSVRLFEVDNETEFEDIETKLENIKGAYKKVLEFSSRKNQIVQKSREMRSRREYKSR